MRRETRRDRAIHNQAIRDAAAAFGTTPQMVRLGEKLIKTGRKDLNDAVAEGRLTLRQALKIVRSPPPKQREFSW
jgi:hypothetical protein